MFCVLGYNSATTDERDELLEKTALHITGVRFDGVARGLR